MKKQKNAFKILLEKNALGAGVLYTPDCKATYEELKAKGVQFKGDPNNNFTVLKQLFWMAAEIGLA